MVVTTFRKTRTQMENATMLLPAENTLVRVSHRYRDNSVIMDFRLTSTIRSLSCLVAVDSALSERDFEKADPRPLLHVPAL